MNDKKDRLEIRHFIKNLSGKSKFVISKKSRAIGISRQTYQNKLDNLRNRKIITNFTININPNLKPNNLKYVMLEIKTNPKEPELVEQLLKIPQITMLNGIFGEFSLFALFIFKSPEEYYQILNNIDKIMARSYFKKYQIIETIKVFKTNGISLRSLNMSYEEQFVEQLNCIMKQKKDYETNSDSTIENIELKLAEKVDLNQISRNYMDIEYNPKKFPGILIKIEKFNITILIFSSGKIVVTGLRETQDTEKVINEIIKTMRKFGINLDKKTIDLNLKIDNIDYEILQILRDQQGDKPISTYEIKSIFKEQFSNDISQSTIHNRIKNLESQNIILNYTINFSPKELGYKGKFILRIKPKNPSKYNELAFKLENNKNITDLFRIGEQYGLLAIVRVKKIEDYGNFLRELYLTEEIEDTFTHFVLDELIKYTNFLIF
ncbi:MAG: Lrp/AsnC ligand binding domain-containing protein [Promethearchaeota archaeon]